MPESPIFRSVVYIILFLFMVCANLVPHTGSVASVLLTLAGLPFCFSSRLRPHSSGKEKAVLWAFAVFFGVYLLSFVLQGLWGHLEDPRLKYLDHRIRLLFMVPIFFLFKRIRLKADILWYSVCAGAAVTGVYALVSKFWLQPGLRVTGSYHSIAFGDLAIVMAAVSLVGSNFFLEKKKAYVAIPIAAFFLGTAACLLSGSKGAWIAFPGFAVIMFFFLGNRMTIWSRLLVGLSVCMLGFFVYHMPVTGVAERMQAMTQEWHDYQAGLRTQTSIAERMEGWKAAWTIYKQNPVVGAGVGNFKPIVKRMVADGEASDIIAKYSQPHNLYLYGMAECGIPGLLAILGVFAVPLWVMMSFTGSGDETVRDLAYGGLMLVVGFMHFALTESIFGRNINISFYVIMLAMVLAAVGVRVEKMTHTAKQ